LSEQSLPDLPVPSGWAKNVKSAVLHVISLAQYAIVASRGWAADALNPRARQAAENDRLKQEIQLLHEELRIKTARIAKIDPRHRPFYPPTERMAILELKAARGWSLAQAARAFLVEADTVATWLKRIDEDGSSALVQLRGKRPVNCTPRARASGRGELGARRRQAGQPSGDSGVQRSGSSSSTRAAGWSLIRAITSRRYTNGSRPCCPSRKLRHVCVARSYSLGHGSPLVVACRPPRDRRRRKDGHRSDGLGFPQGSHGR